jgi:hypothetical protein
MCLTRTPAGMRSKKLVIGRLSKCAKVLVAMRMSTLFVT